MKHAFAITIVMLAVATLPSAPAAAQSRVFVAAAGSDTGNCSFGQPCRTFQHAHDVVAAGGEIDVLDPAGYGSLTISKAISIQGHGYAGVSAASGDAIMISAGPTDVINLRGLLLDGAGGIGSTNNGIVFNTGGALNVQDTLVRNFGGDGILLSPNAASVLTISNSQVLANRSNGIEVSPTGGGAVTGTFDHVVAANNHTFGITINGVSSSGTLTFTVADSTVSNNVIGVSATSTVAATGVFVRDSTLANNSSDGVLSSGGAATVWITKSTFTNSDSGITKVNGGTITTFGDNSFADNGQDGAPSGTVALK